ncbi:MAG: polysaccharide deacetylase family protein [Lachnospiraceae bacterium]|nr:polysaccharide deacetylase family protein [Lachnospiraceae bacterium]
MTLKRMTLICFSVIIAVCSVVILKKGVSSLCGSFKDRELPIYSVETSLPQVSISFDAAWGNEDTHILLDILKQYNIHATFFMTGGWIESYPDDVKAIFAAGHDLGNHSENHKNMSQLSVSDNTDEIMKPHNKVKELTGYDMFLFRPPYGDYDNEVISTTLSLKYYPIQWSVDSLDWKDYGADSIVSTILNHKHLTNGAIILMHNGAKYTKDALPQVIEGLISKGYEIVPISELILRDNYHMDDTGKQISDLN